MKTGLIDAAEFNNPTSDSQFGMQDVSKHYHLGSFHQSQEMFEIPMNTKRLKSLSPAHQAILKNAAYAANSDNYFKALVRYSDSLAELMNKHKVNVYQTSDAILAEQFDFRHTSRPYSGQADSPGSSSSPQPYSGQADSSGSSSSLRPYSG